jgi:hypothetical protein
MTPPSARPLKGPGSQGTAEDPPLWLDFQAAVACGPLAHSIAGPLGALWITIIEVAGTDLIHSICSGSARHKMYLVPTKGIWIVSCY